MSDFEWRYCVGCDQKYYWHPVRHSNLEFCQVCVSDQKRAELLDSLPVFPNYRPCKCIRVMGYDLSEATGYYVCRQCGNPAYSDPRQHPDCIGCDEKFTINALNTSRELCHTCMGIPNP